MRTCVILNPGAGRCEDPDTLEELVAGELVDTEVRRTGGAGEARSLARAAVREGFDRVVAAGGDGTVHEVLNGLAPDFSPVLGVLPVGTANDFARSLGLEPGPADALVALREGRVARMDLLEVRRPAGEEDPGGASAPDESGGEAVERHGANVAVGGVGGRVSEDVDPGEKRDLGSLAYMKSALGRIADLPRYDCRIEVDGTVVRRGLLNLVVANGRFTGGHLAVAPRARLDDGRLDVVLVDAVGLPKLARVAAAFAAGRGDDSDAVEVRRGRRVAVRSDPPMHFRCDGEPNGATPFEFRVAPGRLDVTVGPRGASISHPGER